MQILLVIILSKIKSGRVDDFRRDSTKTSVVQADLKLAQALIRFGPLRGIKYIDP